MAVTAFILSLICIIYCILTVSVKFYFKAFIERKEVELQLSEDAFNKMTAVCVDKASDGGYNSMKNVGVIPCRYKGMKAYTIMFTVHSKTIFNNLEVDAEENYFKVYAKYGNQLLPILNKMYNVSKDGYSVAMTCIVKAPNENKTEEEAVEESNEKDIKAATLEKVAMETYSETHAEDFFCDECRIPEIEDEAEKKSPEALQASVEAEKEA